MHTALSANRYDADRWRKFLSSVSHAATRSGFAKTRDASIVARWLSAHARDWANAAAAS